MELVRVFVPTYHRDPLVKASLRSMLDTSRTAKYDIRFVIVDNRSSDDLRSWLLTLTEDPRVTVELLDKNIGKAKAINAMTAKYNDFMWFCNFDSDLQCKTDNWLETLIECYKVIPDAGMVATSYVDNGNQPQPKQPRCDTYTIDGKTYTFKWGGGVAGGCFVCRSDIWWLNNGYQNTGVYGGDDGLFRYNTADRLYRRCGFISEVVMEHPNDKDTDYFRWKMAIHERVKKFGGRADPKILGSEVGFFDVDKGAT